MSASAVDRLDLGRSEFTVRTAGAVERTGSPTEQRKQRNPRQERRDRHPPNPKRRHIYDLLFDEIDRIDSLDDRLRERLKTNLRNQLTNRAVAARTEARTQRPAAPVPDGEALAEKLLREPDPIPLDHDDIVQLAAPTAQAKVPVHEALENAILAAQLRDCLSRNTETARRVAVYLHLLLSIDGMLRPHTIVEV